MRLRAPYLGRKSSMHHRIALQLACAVAVLLAQPSLLTAELAVKQVDLDVRLDPPARMLYAKATVTLHNRGEKAVEIIELAFPPPLGARVQVNAVWDRQGEMEWRSDPVEGESEPRSLLLATRTPLRAGKKLVVVVSFDIRLEGMAVDAAVVLTEESARLGSAGWYPLPSAAHPVLPQRLRLTVRLPRAWQVSAPVRLKPLPGGTVLTGYELDWKKVKPGVVLFEAWSRSQH